MSPSHKPRAVPTGATLQSVGVSYSKSAQNQRAAQKACDLSFRSHLCPILPTPPLLAAPRSGMEGSQRAARRDWHSAPPPKPPQPSLAQLRPALRPPDRPRPADSAHPTHFASAPTLYDIARQSHANFRRARPPIRGRMEEDLVPTRTLPLSHTPAPCPCHIPLFHTKPTSAVCLASVPVASPRRCEAAWAAQRAALWNTTIADRCSHLAASYRVTCPCRWGACILISVYRPRRLPLV